MAPEPVWTVHEVRRIWWQPKRWTCKDGTGRTCGTWHMHVETARKCKRARPRRLLRGE